MPSYESAAWTMSAAVVLLGALLGCNGAPSSDAGAAGNTPPEDTHLLAEARRRMLDRHLRGRGVSDAGVLEAMASVPREEFVPAHLRSMAYSDHPLPIGSDQTISQPYIVAYMTEAARPRPGDRALEIGTGSGYQAAVLSLLVDTVYTVEILPELTERATEVLHRLGYGNVVTATRDGYKGWPERAPFDVIIVTAAPDHVPQPLVDQLAPGGRMIIPVGDQWQYLKLLRKDEDGHVTSERMLDVRFVPMTGEAQERPR